MRVGFIVNSRVPSFDAIRRGMPPWGLALGWDDAGATMSYMRFRWLARFQPEGIHYELYRPWRFYEAVVFMKSMGAACMETIARLRKVGTAVLFEANVDYYTTWNGLVPMADMAPTPQQKADAEQITKMANAVIASSRHLTQICARMNPAAHWVADNILPEFLTLSRWNTGPDGRLPVWWSGMAAKSFELLAAEESLLHFQDRIHLHMVMDDFSQGKAKWRPEVSTRFETFLSKIPHTFHRFKSIPHLLKLYSTGGVIISPRFLEIPYNLGHSEWKITLGMACGLPALASPQPSYEDVAQRAHPDAIRICRNYFHWEEALEWACTRPQQPSEEAQEVVRRHYLSPLIAEQHRKAVQSAL